MWMHKSISAVLIIAGLLPLAFTVPGCGAPEVKAADAAPAAAPTNTTTQPKGRVIILGFDGVDPGIVDGMIKAGELPSLKKLAEDGAFQPLGSSNPPQSPTAWSNFATCKNPLNHGIFDFLRRNPAVYVPSPGFGIAKHPELAPDGSLTKAPEYTSFRKGQTFWKAASDQGARVKALIVPFAYPIDDLSEGCCQLCGLDVQDLRSTQSTYFAFAEDFEENEEVAGGKRMPLRFTGNEATVAVPGIRVPGKPGTYAEVPIKFTVDRAAKTVAFSMQGVDSTVPEGAWSRWMEWTFELSPKYHVRAISRFHVMAAGELVRVYMTCLQYHPREPMIPISAPGGYAAELADRYGLYKTVGWAYDTKALEKDDMSEEMFLEDVKRTMAWREQLTLDEIDRGNFDLFIAAWTATDRVSHMFWRFRDPKHPLYTPEMGDKYGREVEKTYIKMDEIVGNVMSRLKEGDLLMLLSDHGFHSFRYGFNVNTWLVRNGYLAVSGMPDSATAYTDERFLIDFKTHKYHYDWSKTKAYGLGLGMIFLNRKGREGQGIVTEEEAPVLLEELKQKLLAVTDPNNGDKVFRNVYTFPHPQGDAVAEAPDIQLGYAEGYQTAKASAAGAAPKEIFEPNLNKWSGEHASSDVDFTPGIFFANQKTAPKPVLLDLGVTALKYLGLQVPADFEGKPLL